jgi:hypothetical protein
VDYLRERLSDADLGQAYAAWQALHRMTDDDSRRVSDAVTDAIASAELVVTPAELELTSGPAELRLAGPPIALTAAAKASVSWLKVEQDGPVITVRADAPREAQASLTLTGPTGELTVPVRLTLPSTESEPPPPPPEPEQEPPPPAPLPEPPRTEPAATTPKRRTPWWVVAVLVAGAVALIYLNWPGQADTRKLWYDEANTGWYVYRSSGDPIIVSSFVALLTSLAARSARPVVLGILAGSLAAIIEHGLLILVGGISSAESVKLFGAWTNETTAWLLTGAVALVMAAVLLFHYRPDRLPLWPVPRVAAVLVIVGGVLLMLSALLQDSSGVSFFHVTGLAVLEPFVVAALAWFALAAKWGSVAGTWLSAVATTYALISIVAVVPAATKANTPSVFVVALLGNALVIAAVLSRALRLPSRP